VKIQTSIQHPISTPVKGAKKEGEDVVQEGGTNRQPSNFQVGRQKILMKLVQSQQVDPR